MCVYIYIHTYICIWSQLSGCDVSKFSWKIFSNWKLLWYVTAKLDIVTLQSTVLHTYKCPAVAKKVGNSVAISNWRS